MLASNLNPNEFTYWALPLDVLEWLEKFITDNNIKKIIECGSGLSTIFLGEMKKRKIIEHSLSLEHDDSWYNYLLERLQEKGLCDYTDLQLTPIKEQECLNSLRNWYDISQIQPFTTDLIIVDGPPGESMILARYPAPYLLKDFIQPGCWILIDDYYREQENHIVKLWCEELPISIYQTINIGKGLALCRYN